MVKVTLAKVRVARFMAKVIVPASLVLLYDRFLNLYARLFFFDSYDLVLHNLLHCVLIFGINKVFQLIFYVSNLVCVLLFAYNFLEIEFKI